MIHTLDGDLRFSPRDLISYLEGDFATWCDRLEAEGKRGGNRAATTFERVKRDKDEELELGCEADFGFK